MTEEDQLLIADYKSYLKFLYACDEYTEAEVIDITNKHSVASLILDYGKLDGINLFLFNVAKLERYIFEIYALDIKYRASFLEILPAYSKLNYDLKVIDRQTEIRNLIEKKFYK